MTDKTAQTLVQTFSGLDNMIVEEGPDDPTRPRLCGLSMASEDGPFDCYKEHCEWWCERDNERGGKCVVMIWEAVYGER